MPCTALICATGAPSSLASFKGIDLAAARLHQVAHVEQNERGQAEREHRRGQHELARQVQGIENQQNGVGLGRAGHLALEHVDGDARIFRVGSERVDAGKIDEREVVAAHAGHEAHALLDGDAGIVGDLLAQAGEPIEERGLAGVGRSDEDNGAEIPRAQGPGAPQTPGSRSRHSSRGLGEFMNFGLTSGLRCSAAIFSSSASISSWGVSAALRTRMASAVSRRSAISMPSMP